MPGLQYIPGSSGKGVAIAPSGGMHAMASCKLLSYANAKMFQVIEKLSKEAVARQFKGYTKKIVYWFQQKQFWVGVHVSKEDWMDQSWTKR